MALGLVLLGAVLGRGWAGAPFQSVIVLGDSTVANGKLEKPIRGWGQELPKYLAGVKIENLALSGASSKSFLLSPSWLKAQQSTVDVWLIQFGHNDDPSKGDRATRADGDFKDNLRQMVEMARDTTAMPVFVTMPYRRMFEADGSLRSNQLPYVEAMRSLGKELGVPVIDLYAYTGEVFLRLGDEGSTYFNVTGDRTHFSEKGASELAAVVARELTAIWEQPGSAMKAATQEKGQ